MNSFRHSVVVALVVLIPGSLFAQANGQWVRERHTQYPDRITAEQVAQRINTGNVANWRNATFESTPHPVTRSYAVFAERFYPNANQPAAQVAAIQGQLTKADPFDRLRLNMYCKTYTFPMVAGRTYTIDLMSGDGRAGAHNPGFFDTMLRVEDAQGNIKGSDDDSGDGYNSRVIFTPTQTATYTLVVTSYASKVTGSFTLQVR